MNEEGRHNLKEGASSYFQCTSRDRALFEIGIKMGTVFHQFVGTPVSLKNVEDLEKAFSSSIKAQPFVTDSSVIVDRERLKAMTDRHGYTSLTGDMLKVEIDLEFENWQIKAKMGYKKELDYPLMYVDSVLNMTDKSL